MHNDNAWQCKMCYVLLGWCQSNNVGAGGEGFTYQALPGWDHGGVMGARLALVVGQRTTMLWHEYACGGCTNDGLGGDG